MKLFRVQKMLTAYVLAPDHDEARTDGEDALSMEAENGFDRIDVVEVQPGEEPHGTWRRGHNVYHEESHKRPVTLGEALAVLKVKP